ncbi:MAG: tetratricopeptide repeat protein [Myxococcales bacterium]|nr:tetratricopeptide repeat protein [Myxococcales bacterium]
MRQTRNWLLALIPFALLFGALFESTAFAQGDEMTFEEDEVETSKRKNAEPPPDTTPPTKTLQRATKLYNKKDYDSASIEFAKVINGETEDSVANKQRAEFFMGKTLYQMGYYAASLAYFDRIVELGNGHLYYGVTLKWLAALSRVLPETSGILEKIGQYDPASLDEPVMEEVRNELYFLLGRHFYSEGDFEQAISLFQNVSKKDPFFVKAKFFEGVTYVRQYKGKPAVAAFKDILVIAEERPKYYSKDDVDQFQELAWLQLARVFYSTQQFDTSIKYYEKLTQKSPDWLPSLFEASWAYFMKTNNSKALGNIHTLNAPYFEDQFFPESVLLESVIYYKYCQYDRALAAVAEYDDLYRPLRKDLDEMLGKYEDNAEFYEYVKKVLKAKAGLPDATQRLALSALGDKMLRKTFAWVDELDKELKMLEKADKAWQTTSIAAEVLQELTVQQSLAQADAGKLARERIERLSKELRELSRDGLKIKLETLENKAGQVSASARGQQISGHNRLEPIVIDDEHFMWKFNGEYWKDELGFYRFRVRSKCPVKGAS